MRVLSISILTVFLGCVSLPAQTVKKIEVIGPPMKHVDAVFVSDVYYHLGDISFIHSLEDYMYSQYGITNIAIERSESHAYLMNRYIQDNDSAIFFYKLPPATVSTLEAWRAINKNLSPQNRITFYGIDFERMEFIKALQSIFKRHDNARNTALYSYINGLPDSLCYLNVLGHEAARLRIKTYGKARQLFDNEDNVLKDLLQEDYAIVVRILKNPVTEKHFGKRDITMAKKIATELKGKKFICFMGDDHLDLYRRASSLSLYLRHAHTHDIILVSLVTKNFPPQGKNYQEVPDPANYLTMGWHFLQKNDTIMALGYGRYHRPGYYSLVNLEEFKGIAQKDNKGIATYCVFTDLLDK